MRERVDHAAHDLHAGYRGDGGGERGGQRIARAVVVEARREHDCVDVAEHDVGRRDLDGLGVRVLPAHGDDAHDHGDRGHRRDGARERTARADVAGPAAQVLDGHGLRERHPAESGQLVFEAGLELIHCGLPLPGASGAGSSPSAGGEGAARVRERRGNGADLHVHRLRDLGFGQAGGVAERDRGAGAWWQRAHRVPELDRALGGQALGRRGHPAQRALFERGAPLPAPNDVERDAVRPPGGRLHRRHAVPRRQRAGERLGGDVLGGMQVVGDDRHGREQARVLVAVPARERGVVVDHFPRPASPRLDGRHDRRLDLDHPPFKSRTG